MKKITKCLLTLCLLVPLGFHLSSCGEEEVPVSDASNIYLGDKQEKFHINHWTYENFDVFTDEEDPEGGTKYKYQLTSGNAYSYIFTTVDGPLADYCYFTLTVKGVIGHSLRVRIGQNFDLLEQNIIGPDFDIALTDEYQNYTLKIRSNNQVKLDVASVIALLPDAGKTGPSYYSNFSIKDAYFSTSVPSDSTWVNTGVDTGEDSGQEVNGWRTFLWTNYKLYPNNQEVQVYIEKAAEWAIIEKEFTLEEGQNLLNFNFINDTYRGNENSISNITFLLRGDVNYRVEDVTYPYDVYYEYKIYNYRLNNNDVKADENGLIKLQIPLQDALAYLDGHMENGVRLVLMIESDVNEKGQIINPEDKYNYDGYGILTIDSMSFSKNSEAKLNPWTAEAWTNYSLSMDQDGVVTVDYTNAGEWASISTELKDVDNYNAIRLVINSVDSSTTNISFALRGDVSGESVTPAGDAYFLYHETTVFNYSRASYETDEAELIIPIAEGLALLEGKYENGLRLCLFIESHAEYASEYDRSGRLEISTFELINME